MDSEKNEIMFWVKNKGITFKAGKGHLFPIDVGNICVASIIENEMRRVENEAKASPKLKKAKSKWVNQYLYGSKGRKLVNGRSNVHTISWLNSPSFGPSFMLNHESAWVAEEILEFGRCKIVRLCNGPVARGRLAALSSVPWSLDFPNLPHSSEVSRQPRGTELNLRISLRAMEEGIPAQFQFQCISALVPCHRANSSR
ncbi:hypothetical protein HAX54_011355 [Datura stramonium]|uniref:Uncharacterized protein n=1 Tax=Datura stramonium TaxID=4076 RepID=A0ABS8Y4R0_DATST|nr:hypothetical protein [Datura stramonium]